MTFYTRLTALWLASLFPNQTNSMLDNSFGKRGIVFTDFVSQFEAAMSIAIQENGRIIVSGDNFDNFALTGYK